MRFHDIDVFRFVSSPVRRRITAFLLGHSAVMSEREIAAILKVSHMSVNRALTKLAELNFVNFVSAGKSHIWQVNKKSYIFKVLSGIINNCGGPNNPISDLKKIIIKHIPENLAIRVVLFGSVAGGLEKPDSDLDLFVLVKDNAAREKLEPCLDKLSAACLDGYGNRLAAYVLTENELRQKKNISVVAAVARGIEMFSARRGRK